MTALASPLRTQSLAHYAKGTPSPSTFLTSSDTTLFSMNSSMPVNIKKVLGSDFLYASHFRNYFIPLPGCFSPFPHGTIRYRSLHLFSLGRWSSQVQAGLHVSDPTQDTPTASFPFVYGALTLYGRPFQGRSPRERRSAYGVLQPPAPIFHACGNRRRRVMHGYQEAGKKVLGLGCSPFARHYSGNLYVDFFSPVTEMFQFTE